INKQMIRIWPGSRGSKSKSFSFVDEINREDSFEDIARRNLTFFKGSTEFSETSFAFEMCFGHCSTNNCEDWIRTFGREFIRDECIQPACCDCILFKCGCFKQFNEIFDCCTEFSTNTEFFEGD